MLTIIKGFLFSKCILCIITCKGTYDMVVKNSILDKNFVKWNMICDTYIINTIGTNLNFVFSLTQVFQWVNMYLGPNHIRKKYNL